MMAERWNQVMDMFSAVADHSPNQQKAYLDEMCAHDPDLRAQVEELLTNHAMAETKEFLKEPPWVIDEIPVCLRDFDDYKQIEYVGHGGMGVVYKAFDESLDTQVALKMSLPRRLTTAEDISRFRIDPQSMAKLKHPNVVQVHKVGEWDGKPYFTMNLIERKDGSVSLVEHLARFRDDPAAAATLMIKVARAVHHAHQRGILHRDLKPGNILLDDEDNPHITDFGLAKRIGSDAKLTETGEPLNTASVAYSGIVGTVKYMSPEQADPHPDQEVTTLSDVYGLGATLYTLLTGRPPFQAETLEATLQLVRDPEQKPIPPRQLNPQVDRTLEAVCLKCMDKNPARRYPSAEGLAKNLERWLRHEDVDPLQPAWLRFWNWCRRHPAVASLTVTVVALLIFVTVATVSVAQKRTEMLEREVIGSNQYAAKHVANTVLLYFRDWSDLVVETSQARTLKVHLQKNDMQQDKKHDDMRNLIIESENGKQLQKFCEETFKRYEASKKFQRVFNSWYVFNKHGIIVALSPGQKIEETIGKHFDGREYFTFHKNRSQKGSAHVSRVFLSEDEGLYKYAISAAVLDDKGDFVGVVAASIDTSATLGSTVLSNERQNVVVIGRGDPNPARDGAERQPYDYPILIHDAYQGGDDPVEFPNGELLFSPPPHGPELELPDPERVFDRDADYKDPVAGRYPEYGGRWLAAFAPVGNTEFVVIVQQRYDEAVTPPISLLKDTFLWGGVALLLVVIPIGAALWHGVQRATDRPGTPRGGT